MRKIDNVEPIAGKVEGVGPGVRVLAQFERGVESRQRDSGRGRDGQLSAKPDDMIYATGRVAPIFEKDGVDAKSMAEAPAGLAGEEAAHRDCTSRGRGNIDEGWTRWIFEQFHFPFTRLHNADIQDGHLREMFDTIVIAEMGTRQIMDGMQPGTVPGQYAGGIGEDGADALREFVDHGGTLITLGNASLFPIDQFKLPVTNALAGLRPDQFFCSGTLLQSGDQGPTSSGGRGSAGRSDGHVRAQRGVRYAGRISAATFWRRIPRIAIRCAAAICWGRSIWKGKPRRST